MKKIIVLISIAVFAISCDNIKSEWQKVQKSDSLQVYRKFIIEYPNSKYADSAQINIDILLHPLRNIGFPDLELIQGDIGMTCWDDSVSIVAYEVLKPTFISWDDLEQYFNWESKGARLWYPKGVNVTSAGIFINEKGERVSFGSTCIGYDKIILISGSTIKKSNGILFNENSILAHQKY